MLTRFFSFDAFDNGLAVEGGNADETLQEFDRNYTIDLWILSPMMERSSGQETANAETPL